MKSDTTPRYLIGINPLLALLTKRITIGFISFRSANETMKSYVCIIVFCAARSTNSFVNCAMWAE